MIEKPVLNPSEDDLKHKESMLSIVRSFDNPIILIV